MSKTINHIPCPCNPTKAYSECCEPFHLDKAIADTAEKLMRSRYSAYVLKLDTYIRDTWHPSSRPILASFTDQPIKWLSLTVEKSWPSEQANEAFVEFTARCKVNGKAQKMHEISRFIFENARWLYLEGKLS